MKRGHSKSRNRFAAAGIAAVFAALTLSGCPLPDAGLHADEILPSEPGEQPSYVNDDAEELVIGGNQAFFSYNPMTPNGNHIANAEVLHFTTANFYHFDDQLNQVNNTDFGTITVVDEDPFTVELTINDGVVWSDGTPIDAADLMLMWGAQNDKMDTVASEAVETDADGNPIVPENEVYFHGGSPYMEQVEETPQVSADGRTLTMVFSNQGQGPTSDWQMGISLPSVAAHVIARRALGITDPTEAKQAVIAAFQNHDRASLSALANVWNNDFNYTSLPDDPGLYLSSGPYVISDLAEGQYVVLDRNPHFAWGPKPEIEQIVIRWTDDPLAQVQALRNNDVDIIGPQATVDLIAELDAVPGVKSVMYPDDTWELVNLTYNNGGPFDPATYGGNEDTARTVRQAFLMAIPREEIVEKLIRPLQSDAQVRNSLLFAPIGDRSDYEAAVAANGAADLYTGDVARAKKMLEQAGVQLPIHVRLLYAANNPRRVEQVRMMQEAMISAGIELQPAPHEPYSELLGSGTYDAVLMAWTPDNPYLLNSRTLSESGGANNFGAFSNERVDELWNTIGLTQDGDVERAAGIEIDTILLQDGMSLPIYQRPSLVAYDDDLQNVIPMPLGVQWMWNFWDWTFHPATTEPQSTTPK